MCPTEPPGQEIAQGKSSETQRAAREEWCPHNEVDRHTLSHERVRGEPREGRKENRRQETVEWGKKKKVSRTGPSQGGAHVPTVLVCRRARPSQGWAGVEQACRGPAWAAHTFSPPTGLFRGNLVPRVTFRLSCLPVSHRHQPDTDTVNEICPPPLLSSPNRRNPRNGRQGKNDAAHSLPPLQPCGVPFLARPSHYTTAPNGRSEAGYLGDGPSVSSRRTHKRGQGETAQDFCLKIEKRAVGGMFLWVPTWAPPHARPDEQAECAAR